MESNENKGLEQLYIEEELSQHGEWLCDVLIWSRWYLKSPSHQFNGVTTPVVIYECIHHFSSFEKMAIAFFNISSSKSLVRSCFSSSLTRRWSSLNRSIPWPWKLALPYDFISLRQLYILSTLTPRSLAKSWTTFVAQLYCTLLERAIIDSFCSHNTKLIVFA